MNSPLDVPRHDGLAIQLSKRSVGLGEDALGRHPLYEFFAVLAPEHCRTYTEPAAKLYCPVEVPKASRKPMENRCPCASKSFQAVENRRTGAAAMNRQHTASKRPAFFQNMLEYVELNLPMISEFRSAVQTDFADIAGLRDEAVKELQFVGALMGQLGMQAQAGPNPF